MGRTGAIAARGLSDNRLIQAARQKYRAPGEDRVGERQDRALSAVLGR